MAHFKIYQDSRGEFRWKFIAGNGRIMADSAEGYDNQLNAARAVERLIKLVAVAEVEVEDLA